MSANSNNSAGIAGSDESFISFAFAIVSLIALAVYLPLLIRAIKYIVNFIMARVGGSQPSRRSRLDDDANEESPLAVIMGYITFVPSVVLFFVRNPLSLVEGASLSLAERGLFLFVCFPRFLKFCFRPKVFILWLWFILFSSAMYSTLTFDAHGILGVPKTASTGDIKKAYRALIKVNHPDHNKTDAARSIYFNVRKAYKALVDKDAFEAEAAQEEQFAVGIALPRFMTSHENDGLVLFGLLAVLFGVPLAIWWKLSGSDSDKLQSCMLRISQFEPKVEALLQRLGVPVDARLQEKRRSRQEILRVLRKVGLAGPQMGEADVAGFPNFIEFRSRCLNPAKFKQALLALGLDEEGLARLTEHFTQFPQDGDELQTPIEQLEFARVSQPQYLATRFLLEQLISYIDAAATTIDDIFKTELRATRRLRNHHRDVLDTVTIVYDRDRATQSNIDALMDAGRRGEELTHEVPVEINGLFKKMQTRYLQEMGYGDAKQQKKMMQRQQRMMQAGGMRPNQVAAQ